MFKPDDPLKPRDRIFNQAWQAQTLGLADTLIQAGYFSAADWALALGRALKDAEQTNEPDTAETYYHCAIAALELLVTKSTAIDRQALGARKQAWTAAYLSTPHGQPVTLKAGQN